MLIKFHQMNKILTFFILLVLTSCEIETITPGSYSVGKQPTNDTTNYLDQYTYGGVLIGDTTNNYTKILIGTSWVIERITPLVSGFPISITTQLDTIHFIDVSKYVLNGDTLDYKVFSVRNRLTLTLYSFTAFNGAYCYTDNLYPVLIFSNQPRIFGIFYDFYTDDELFFMILSKI